MRTFFNAPLFWLIIPFLSGIAAGKDLFDRSVSDWINSPISIIFCFCLFFISTERLFFIIRKPDSKKGETTSFLLTTTFWFFSFFLIFIAGQQHILVKQERFTLENKRINQLAESRSPHILSFKVTSAPIPYEQGIRFIAELLSIEFPGSSTPVKGRLSISLKGGEVDTVTPGDIVRGKIYLKPIRNFKNPGSFDYENWWKLREIAVRGFIKTPLDVYRTDHDDQPFLQGWYYKLERFRQKVVMSILLHMDDKGSNSIALALVTGNKTLMDSRLREVFSSSGMGHLLAVSGLHMAMAAFVAGFFVRFFLLCSMWALIHLPVMKIAVTAGAAAAFIYSALAGFSPSATRAMIMIAFFAFSYIIAMPSNGLNTLALSAWVLLLISPFYLFDISFQFSFMAVFFLIAGIYAVPNFKHREDDNPLKSLLIWIAGITAVTVLASLATAPLSAFYFNRISFAGTVANIIAVPLTGFVILPALIAAIVISFILPSFSTIFWKVADMAIHFLVKTALITIDLPLSSKWVVSPDFFEIAIYFICLLVTIFMFHRRYYAQGVCTLFLGIAIFSGYPDLSSKDHGELIVHFLDVGQGTAQVVELPGGKVMVVDGGGFRNSNFDTGKRIVAPFLGRLGYYHIDILALSHPDQDHLGGLLWLLKNIKVKNIWHSVAKDNKSTLWQAFTDAANKSKAKISVWQVDHSLNIDGVDLELFTGHYCKGLTRDNNMSLVISLSWQDKTVLLTGDIEKARERCFIRKWKERGKVNILAVPHHGSRTSSSKKFLETLHPEIAVISVGWRNYFNLPHYKVISRLRKVDARIYRTDVNGSVSIKISPVEFNIMTSLQETL